ncbi:MAG: hypothetical protein LBU64_14640, partial [Planctomycetota bacterium]|nr:hypothetical protein [Planctomycetota bacterium]
MIRKPKRFRYNAFGADKGSLLNAVSSGYTASKVASRMIFALDLRPKIIPPAPFSLSNPDDPAFN